MSDQYFKTGQQGRDFTPDMNREDYDAGQSAQRTKDALMSGKSYSGFGSGGGALIVGAIILFPTLPLVYPLCGALAIGFGLAAKFGLGAIGWDNFASGLFIFAGTVTIFLLTLKTESRLAARSKIYRMIRVVTRWMGVTLFVLAVSSRGGHPEERRLKTASPAKIIVGLVAAGLAHRFIFPNLDRHEADKLAGS